MSHIPGHIDTKPKSTGVLVPCSITGEKLTLIDSCKVIFVPPSSWQPNKGEKVGFHLLTIHCMGEEKLIAYDLVKWDDHKEAEAIAQKALNTTANLERYCYDKRVENRDPAKVIKIKSKIEARCTTNAKKRHCWDVVDRTIGYVDTTDFSTIYLDGPRIKDTNEIVTWIQINKAKLLQP